MSPPFPGPCGARFPPAAAHWRTNQTGLPVRRGPGGPQSHFDFESGQGAASPPAPRGSQANEGAWARVAGKARSAGAGGPGLPIRAVPAVQASRVLPLSRAGTCGPRARETGRRARAGGPLGAQAPPSRLRGPGPARRAPLAGASDIGWGCPSRGARQTERPAGCSEQTRSSSAPAPLGFHCQGKDGWEAGRFARGFQKEGSASLPTRALSGEVSESKAFGLNASPCPAWPRAPVTWKCASSVGVVLSCCLRE